MRRWLSRGPSRSKQIWVWAKLVLYFFDFLLYSIVATKLMCANQFMRGSVDVQSRARRSYRAGVMPTEALFALGMLKLASRMMGEFEGG